MSNVHNTIEQSSVDVKRTSYITGRFHAFIGNLANNFKVLMLYYQNVFLKTCPMFKTQLIKTVLMYSVMQSDGIVFAKMSSWTDLTWYTGMKTAFKTKIMKNESFGILL